MGKMIDKFSEGLSKKDKEFVDLLRLISGIDEIEITEDLIQKLIKEKKWTDPNSLRHLAKLGAKFNVRTKSVFIWK